MKEETLLKKCDECCYEKPLSEYEENRKTCKKCRNKYRSDLRKNREPERYIYIFTIDGIPARVGSTTDLTTRMSEYRTRKGQRLIDICNKNRYDYEGKEIILWLLDLREQFEGMTEKDLRYHEHKIIRILQQRGQGLLNINSKWKLEKRERRIDEHEAFISYDNFKKTDIKVIK